MKSSKFLILSTLATLLVMLSVTPAKAASDPSYDMTYPGTDIVIQETINGAIWESLPSTEPTGSGVWHAFFRVQKNGTELGYNTDGRPLQFDEKTSLTFTHKAYLSEVPKIWIGGIPYREFQLDINEKSSEPLISLDSFQVWTTNDGNLLGYDPTPGGVTPYSGTFPIGTGTGEAQIVYDLDGDGDTWIMMDYRWNTGSGKRDYRVMVPDINFLGKELEFVVIFTNHGIHEACESGFEEWGVALYEEFNPDISITKTPSIDEFCLSDVPVPVTYTYLVENIGDEDLENVVVTDDTCSSPAYVSGDDGDGLLNPLEVWTYECTTDLYDTTTNIGTVVAYGVTSGAMVTDNDDATVTANNVAVEIDPAAAEICEGDEPVHLCAVASLGSGDYSYLWSTGETTECIDVEIDGVYWVIIHDNVTGCEDYAEATLNVISVPLCLINGPTEVLEFDTEIPYESNYSADTYSWSIEGNGASIIGPTDGPSILVDPGTGEGSFTLTLYLCNEGDVIECCNECILDVDVETLTPGIDIYKYPDIEAFCLNDVPVPVTYTYEVTNTGDEVLVGLTVEDDTCEELTRMADLLGNDDDVFEPSEVWVFECTMDLYDTTENYVYAVALGETSGTKVFDDDIALVEAFDVAVEVTPLESEICEGDEPVELTANVTLGSEDYSYLWSTGETTQSIFVDEEGEYCVTVTDNITGCVAEACANLYVIDTPECSIVGPSSICIGNTVEFCASDTTADTYEWVIAAGEEYAEIVGDNTGPCVDVLATGEGTFVLALLICNEGNPEPIYCCDECFIEVPVVPCDTFCSFTQGFWGNAGGTACDPALTTTELLTALIPPSVIVGSGVNTIEFTSPQDVLDGLPAGGPPKAISGGPYTYATLPNNMKYKDGRVRNVLVGQVVALTLNLRLYPGCLGDGSDLGSYVLPAELTCTVPYGQEEACVEQFEIPEELQGNTVAELLAIANAALGGDTTYSLSDIYKAVTAINVGFDGCRTIVPCIRPEICDNGCDDDGDGDVDCDDLDCSGVGDCPIIVE